MQEELDAYDRIHKESENVNEYNHYRVKQLEDFITQSNMKMPEADFHKSTEVPKEIPTMNGNNSNNIKLEGNNLPYNVTNNNLEMEEKV